MNPLEEQVEKVARELNLEAGRQRGLSDVDDWDYITEQERGGWRNMAKTAIAVLLPLEVTDESVNVPKAALAQVMAIVRLTYPVRPESLAAEAIRQCNAALTQKGDNE